ncbi:unnamed protein product [Amoebophrya sp. A120]|nr:unnamed protein product [Amoebophrya sp. A120]|eukprot:GSA120T00011365001.1
MAESSQEILTSSEEPLSDEPQQAPAVIPSPPRGPSQSQQDAVAPRGPSQSAARGPSQSAARGPSQSGVQRPPSQAASLIPSSADQSRKPSQLQLDLAAARAPSQAAASRGPSQRPPSTQVQQEQVAPRGPSQSGAARASARKPEGGSQYGQQAASSPGEGAQEVDLDVDQFQRFENIADQLTAQEKARQAQEYAAASSQLQRASALRAGQQNRKQPQPQFTAFALPGSGLPAQQPGASPAQTPRGKAAARNQAGGRARVSPRAARQPTPQSSLPLMLFCCGTVIMVCVVFYACCLSSRSPSEYRSKHGHARGNTKTSSDEVCNEMDPVNFAHGKDMEAVDDYRAVFTVSTSAECQTKLDAFQLNGEDAAVFQTGLKTAADVNTTELAQVMAEGVYGDQQKVTYPYVPFAVFYPKTASKNCRLFTKCVRVSCEAAIMINEADCSETKLLQNRKRAGLGRSLLDAVNLVNQTTSTTGGNNHGPDARAAQGEQNVADADSAADGASSSGEGGHKSVDQGENGATSGGHHAGGPGHGAAPSPANATGPGTKPGDAISGGSHEGGKGDDATANGTTPGVHAQNGPPSGKSEAPQPSAGKNATGATAGSPPLATQSAPLPPTPQISYMPRNPYTHHQESDTASSFAAGTSSMGAKVNTDVSNLQSFLALSRRVFPVLDSIVASGAAKKREDGKKAKKKTKKKLLHQEEVFLEV